MYECTIVKIPSVTFQYFTSEDHKETNHNAEREVQERLITSGYSKK
jgi:hypothetical protein